jgi:proteasome lid subunit RPN8/RPN11
MAVSVTDLVYEQIRAQIAGHNPELGGALYGPRGVPVVSHFEFDAHAVTTPVSYVPSTQLIENVMRVEGATGLQFKGVVHSHPSGMTHPSGGDESTVSSFFRMNPHFSAMALPIVQRQVGDGEFLYWYRAERRAERNRAFLLGRTDGVAIIPEEFHVLPILKHFNLLLAAVRGRGINLNADERLQTLQLKNAPLFGLVAASEHGHEVMFFVPMDYPITAPVVLFRSGDDTKQLPVAWAGLGDAEANIQSIAESLSRMWEAGAHSTPAIVQKTTSSKPEGQHTAQPKENPNNEHRPESPS